MSKQAEGYFHSFDNTKLFFRRWSSQKRLGNLIITHGQAEHSGCYHRLVDALKDFPVDIYGWDLRGHGRSEGLRGYVDSFHDYIRDFEEFLKKLTLETSLAREPIFLFSHSMGGLIQMRTLCERPQLPIAAQVLSSPMFGISVPVPAYKEKSAHFIQRFLPKLTLGNEIRFEDLSRDPEILREFQNDTLRHEKISAGVYLGSKTAMSECRAMASRVQVPSLLLMSDQDPVTSTPDALEVFSRMGASQKVQKIYTGARHELFNDIIRDQAAADLKEFLQSFLPNN